MCLKYLVLKLENLVDIDDLIKDLNRLKNSTHNRWKDLYDILLNAEEDVCEMCGRHHNGGLCDF